MSNNKQSSVEWFAKQLENLQYNPLEKNGYENAKNKIKEQAKAMHMTEIIESYASGSNDRLRNTINTNYYKETFVDNK